MSEEKKSFLRGFLIGIGLSAATYLGYRYVSSRKPKSAILKPLPKMSINENYFSFANIRSQISYVCQKLKMNEKVVLERFFPHVLSETVYEYDVSRITPEEVAEYIDHTQLKAQVKDHEIVKLVDEAKKFGFATVCVNGNRVKWCREYAKEVRVAAVIGFPLGCMTTRSKVFETKSVFSQGAEEIDMVICVGKLREGDYEFVYRDIKAVCSVKPEKCVKVILETCYLQPNEIIIGSILTAIAGAKYVKTSTGFGTAGAKLDHVKLMKKVVGETCKVKAAGGIRDFPTAVNMIRVGASRLGCSSGVKIVLGSANVSAPASKPKESGAGMY